jgi:hypothetical protein
MAPRVLNLGIKMKVSGQLHAPAAILVINLDNYFSNAGLKGFTTKSI